MIAELFAAGPRSAGFMTRATLSVLVLAATLLASRGLQRWFSASTPVHGHHARRSAFVASRNVLYALATLVLVSLWLVQLRHFALSVAALATGMLLVGKELVMCLIGRLVHATTRPYGIGDVVDVGTHSGQVIDVGLCTTTLLEMDAARQYTGNTLDVPNALLVTSSVRNLSHTGQYVIESLRVPVAADANVTEHRERLLACAQRACRDHLDDAVRWLTRVEADEVLRLPDFEPRVLIEPKDAYQVDLVVRFPAPAAGRAYVVQAVLQEYYAREVAGRRVSAGAAPVTSVRPARSATR